MCIIQEQLTFKHASLPCYKVISVNKKGIKLPVFLIPIERIIQYYTISDSLEHLYEEEELSPYDEWQEHRIQAFYTEESAREFFTNLNKKTYNIPSFLKNIELWKCDMLPPVYEGLWDMNFDVRLVSGHEIEFVELLSSRKIGATHE